MIGEVIKTIACDLDEGPKVMQVMHAESQRAKLVQRLSEARLRFAQGEDAIKRSIVYQRLYVAMFGVVRSNTRLLHVDSGVTAKDPRNSPGYHGSTWEVDPGTNLNDNDTSPRGENLERARDEGEGAPGSTDAPAPKKKMGCFGMCMNPEKAAARAAAREAKLKADAEEKVARRASLDRKELEKVGFVPPWEADDKGPSRPLSSPFVNASPEDEDAM